MIAHLKISSLVSLLLFNLFPYISAHAEETSSFQPTYHLLTALEDGYYGYSGRRPEETIFVMVKDGEPVVFYPKDGIRTNCKPNYHDDKIFFRMNTYIKGIDLLRGSIGSMPSSFNKNTDTSGKYAAISEVRTDLHLACSGKIVRE
ncbi:hypothetical protein [Pseudomonas sp. 9AZ]|uniref:hypothetical protein n=1 Tax=Pseudomonas sp. 9AZ TaxID=2653168 RepID=UPI00135BA3C0|nr:hypothetical protein [Pseudomonas sp. 9AZ]